MFIWNEQRIKWAKICNETNTLNLKKTDIIKDIIKNTNVMDAGCGLGYLSLEMSKYANNVIALDIDENALDVLNENIKRGNISNIIAIKSDFYKTKFYNIDYTVASFFSKPTRDLEYMLSISKKGVIIITNTDISSYELLNKKTYTNRQDAIILCDYMKKHNLSYDRFDLVGENGQYLENEKDVYNFLDAFSTVDKSQIDELFKKSRLTKTKIIDDKTYEYFVSIKKAISIVIIKK